MLPLDVSVKQQTVLPLYVSILQQTVLPLDVSVIQKTVPPGRVCSTAAIPKLHNFEHMVCVHKIFSTHDKFFTKMKICENRVRKKYF